MYDRAGTVAARNRALAAANSALEQEIGERQRAEIALRESEERLRLALAATNQGLYDLNVQTDDVIVSPEYARMLGYDPAEFHETSATWIARLHPDDHERVARTYRAYLAGELADYRMEFRQRTKAGEDVYKRQRLKWPRRKELKTPHSFWPFRTFGPFGLEIRPSLQSSPRRQRVKSRASFFRSSSTKKRPISTLRP